MSVCKRSPAGQAINPSSQMYSMSETKWKYIIVTQEEKKEVRETEIQFHCHPGFILEARKVGSKLIVPLRATFPATLFIVLVRSVQLVISLENPTKIYFSKDKSLTFMYYKYKLNTFLLTLLTKKMVRKIVWDGLKTLKEVSFERLFAK